MTRFFFNDCLPGDRPEQEYVEALSRSIREFKELSRDHEVCVVTSANQDSVGLSPGFGLLQCVLAIEDRTERAYSLRLFSKYPVGSEFDEDSYIEKVVNNDYTITVDDEKHVATNLAIVALNDGLLFTLGVSDDLRRNMLRITGASASHDVGNLYGDQENTAFVNELLTSRKEQSLSIIDRLRMIVGDNADIRSSFLTEFGGLSVEKQQSVLAKFEVAYGYNMLAPVKADDKIIKDVTPDNGTKGPLYELRIFSPYALRVYFTWKDGRIVLIGVSGKNAQSADIRRAYVRM